jgi:catechol 2,3-dioxygenase-like lactoylglutathione lyase family enzyme
LLRVLPALKPKEQAMIRGVHTMFYTSQPEATRAFFRDKLGLPFTDVGEGWLIFDIPEADHGFHPAEDRDGARTGAPWISFYCDDVEKTMAELKSRGVEFTGPVADQGWGLVTSFKVPGDFAVQLYQPRYAKNPRPMPAVAKAIEAPRAEGTRAAAPAKSKPPAAKSKPAEAPVKKAAVKKAATKSPPPKAKPAKKAKGRR